MWEKLVNPAWKELDGRRRKAHGKITACLQELGKTGVGLTSPGTKEAETVLGQMAEIRRKMEEREAELEKTGNELKEVKKHVENSELPPGSRYVALEPTRKQLMDTVRMTACRAETALASFADGFLSAPDTAGSWIKALMRTPADIIPDREKGSLSIRFYPPGEERINRMLGKLPGNLNETETCFPGTGMTLFFELKGTEKAVLTKSENQT